MKPSCEPTDRSMWRETMTSTMPRRHDADNRDLQRQVEEVAGGQEDTARQKVEAEPDQNEDADHGEQPRIEPDGLRQIVGQRPQRGLEATAS